MSRFLEPKECPLGGPAPFGKHEFLSTSFGPGQQKQPRAAKSHGKAEVFIPKKTPRFWGAQNNLVFHGQQGALEKKKKNLSPC